MKNKFITMIVVCLTFVLLSGCTTIKNDKNTTDEPIKDEERVSYIDRIQEEKELKEQLAKEEEEKKADRAMRAEWVRQSREQREKEAAEEAARAAEAAAIATQSNTYSTPSYSYSSYDYNYEEPETEEVVEEVVEEIPQDVTEETSTAAAAISEAKYSPSEFRRDGVYYEDGYRWTWYSERVLPGGGLDIPGRYTDDQGYVKDEDGYICLASEDLEQGTVVDTPFGSEGKVYDSGCDSGTLDVYVGW